MKKAFLLCMAIIILCTLAACDNSSAADAYTTSNTESGMADTQSTTQQPEENGMPIPTIDSTTESTSATEDTTEPQDHRLVNILRSDFPFFDGPSYDYSPIGTVEFAATYTIVEEVLDAEGNLWGKLKSGAGWVNLSLIEKESHNMPPVTVARASKRILDSGNYHYCQADYSSYAYKISISAHETLLNVSFFSINALNDYERGWEYFRIAQLDSSKPLVASVYFPGPVSMYGLEFTDQSGVTKIYTITESGRNGSVGMSRFYGTLTSPELDTAPWKTAYINYMESLGDEKTYCTYSLVYVDSDDIPELFISGSCEASGSRVCSYKNGQVLTTHLRRLGGASYIPQGGLVYNFNGNMGYYTVEIYRLTDSGFVSLFSAAQEDSYQEVTGDTGEIEYVTSSKYYITTNQTNTEVTEEEFYAAQSEIFDFALCEDFGYGAHSYSAIRQHILDW